MEHNDDKLRGLMKMAKVDLPFDDFEDKVMDKIEELEKEKLALVKTRKYALIFFAFGALFGLGINYLLADLVLTTQIDVSVKNICLLILQLVSVLFIVIFSDKVWQLMKMRKEQLL